MEQSGRSSVPGSVSHVLHTAFRGLYLEETRREEAKRLREQRAQQLASQQRETGLSGGVSAPGKKGKKSSLVPPSEETVREPEVYVSEMERLPLSEDLKALYERELEKIQADSKAKTEELANASLEVVIERETAAKSLREAEDELKRHGVILGQHVPSVPMNLGIGGSTKAWMPSRLGLLAPDDVISNSIERHFPTSKSYTMKRSKDRRYADDSPQVGSKYSSPTKTVQIREEIRRRRFALADHPRDRKGGQVDSEDELPRGALKKTKTAIPSMAEMLEHQEVLKAMNSKLQFKHNPRHDPESLKRTLVRAPDRRSSTSGSAVSSFPDTTTPSSQIFVAVPPAVRFGSFEVGREYSQRLSLKNVSTVQRFLRCIPPGTLEFSASTLEFPPGSIGGLLAPGLSASLSIKFVPKAPIDYNDCVVVESEGGSFEVPLIVIRSGPQLAIASCIDVGKCLIGDALRLEVPVFNSGGRGRYILGNDEVMALSCFDESEFQRRLKGSQRSPPFTLYPSSFELANNQSLSLVVEYVPISLGRHSQSFHVLLDNMESREFTIQGECRTIEVSLSEINGIPLDSESKINTELYLSPTVVGEQSSLQIGVRNDSGIAIEYEWVFLSEDIEDSMILTECEKLIKSSGETYQTAVFNRQKSRILSTDSDDVVQKFAIDMGVAANSCSTPNDNILHVANFSLSPRRGILPELGMSYFDFDFLPIAMGNQGIRAVLMLKRVPHAASADNELARNVLRENGHPHLYRLRSWIETEGVIFPGTFDDHEKLIKVSRLRSMVSTYNFEEKEVEAFENRLSQCVNFCEMWAAYLLDDQDNALEENGLKLNVFIWDGAEHSEWSMVQVPLLSRQVDVTSGNNDLSNIFTESNILDSLWIRCDDAESVLGEVLSNCLEGLIIHEAVHFLQELNQKNLAALALRLSGEGMCQRLTVKPCHPGKLNLPIGAQWSGLYELKNTSSTIVEAVVDLDNLSVWSLDDLRRLDSSCVTLSSSSSRIIVLPDASFEIDFNLQMKELGLIELRVPISSSVESITIDPVVIFVESTSPRLRFEEHEVNFGLHSVGKGGNALLSLFNESTVPIKYVMKKYYRFCV